MRTQININDVNEYGIRVVGGPYSSNKRGSSKKWDFLCPHCEKTFIAPTTNFKKAKSCYLCRGKLLRSYNDSTTWDYLYHVIKGRKVSKEKGFGLTKKHFYEISKMNCHYCGAKPTITSGCKDWHPKIKINGLDRIDPSLGYFDNNVVACCKDCNVAKLDKTEEEFISWLKRIAKYQKINM
jgi:hypothetical protein